MGDCVESLAEVEVDNTQKCRSHNPPWSRSGVLSPLRWKITFPLIF